MRRSVAIHPFLLTWGAFTAVLLAAVLGVGKLDLHRAMVPYHSTALDAVMRHLTHVADGWVPTALALALLVFRDLRSFLLVGLGCGISALLVQAMKRWFDADRPHKFRDLLGDMHWVDGIDLHHHLSFPSGHATAAFSMCLALAILLNTRPAGWILGVVAAVLAYTRVYLSQHFAEDILAGAALGTTTTLAIHWWLYGSSFATRSWLEKRPLAYLNQ